MKAEREFFAIIKKVRKTHNDDSVGNIQTEIIIYNDADYNGDYIL